MNVNSGRFVGRLPSSKREAEMMAPQWLKQASDSVKLINTTKKARVFFDRYDFFLDTLEKLAFCEKWVRFTGTLPSSMRRSAEADRKEQTRLFILRYAQDTKERMHQLTTQRGKLNKAEAYYNTLTEYSNRMSDEHVPLFTEQYEQLKKLAQ